MSAPQEQRFSPAQEKINADRAARKRKREETDNYVFAPIADIVKPAAKPAAKPAKPAAPFSRSLAQILSEPPKPVEWLVRDVLERSVIGLLAGPRGSYKSFFALDLVMRIALKGEAVYIISAEGKDLDRRVRAWLKHHAPGVDGSKLPVHAVERRLDLTNDEVIARIVQDCAALKIRPVCILIDTYSKASPSLDENSNSDTKHFLGRLDTQLKTVFNASVILVAHTGLSDKSRARGASALSADSDVEWIVTKTGEGEGARISISRDRFKSSPELPPLIYTYKVIDLGAVDGEPVTSLVLVPAAVESKPYSGAKPRSGNAEALLAIAEGYLATRAAVTKQELKEDFRALERVGSAHFLRTFNRALDDLTKNGPLTESAGKVSRRTKECATSEFDEVPGTGGFLDE